MKIRPQRLQQGDTIGIIAPSSPPNQENLQKSLAFLEELGLKWQFGKHVKTAHGYLAGTDEERLEDLEDMFANPNVKGIICAGGGYGSARFTDKIDLQLMNENPKIFWGFSDITFLHTAIGRYSNLVTFHGPMLASCVGKDSFHELSAKMFQQLFQPMELHYTEDISPLETITGGVAQGELVGGNLSLLASGIGTRFEVDTKGKILLLEDVGEEAYRVDGLLNQLRLTGKLNDVAGIIVGDFSKTEPKRKKETLSLDEVFDHYLSDLGVPVLKGFKIGHCQPHFAIPLGVSAKLDADNKTLTILPGVE
ncbi:LD-carboxypeptidase [Filibacter tadaridae]|uniref:Putative murein peptide carboxypeptidase n=1 Tax=Filibacter tadaridae TaxID=2483811 RepID=A0A3P5WDJ7_9BACL|nr:LD-carboxypeptidase [Filibacter tadaridae]VDC21623.1 putative murein peptide carboxypeptidase [Filibacter tadaridae]